MVIIFYSLFIQPHKRWTDEGFQAVIIILCPFRAPYLAVLLWFYSHSADWSTSALIKEDYFFVKFCSHQVPNSGREEKNVMSRHLRGGNLFCLFVFSRCLAFLLPPVIFGGFRHSPTIDNIIYYFFIIFCRRITTNCQQYLEIEIICVAIIHHIYIFYLYIKHEIRFVPSGQTRVYTI